MTDTTLIRCDWCGTLQDSKDAGWGGVVVCGQACHEARKLALGRQIGMGVGMPHEYPAPFQPERWPGYREARSAARERSRAAGQRSVVARAQARLSTHAV